MNTADFLATVPLFARVEREELERLAEVTRERQYPKGSVIVFEDDPGDSLFIVREGRVKVVLVSEDGREVILGVLGVGEHFGELSLIDEQPRSAHVIAMEDANLLVLRRDDFRRRVEATPALAWSLLVELSQVPVRVERDESRLRPAEISRLGGDPARLQAATGWRPEIPLERTLADTLGAARELEPAR